MGDAYASSEYGAPVELVSGRPAVSAATVGWRLLPVALAVVGFEFALALRHGYGSVMRFLPVMVVAQGVTIGCYVYAGVQSLREYLAGYTTAPRLRDVDARPQVDVATRRVIRTADEPFLTKEQWAFRRKDLLTRHGPASR